jgi:TonB family protein
MTTLLESGARPYKSRGGIAAAVTLHVVLIAGAIAGTAHVVLPPAEKVEEHTVLYVAPPPPAPLPAPPPPLPKVHVAPRPQVAPPKQAPQLVVKRAPAPPRKTPVLPAPPRVAAAPTPIEPQPAPVITNVVAAPAGPSVAELQAAADKAAADRASAERAAAAREAAEKEAASRKGTGSSQADGSAYLGDQVEREVQRLSGAPVPRYPEQLRANNVSGTVLMRFVVGADGRVESGSFQVIESPEKAFSDAVRIAIMGTRFRPAEVGGRPVRQLVEQSFTFKIDR